MKLMYSDKKCYPILSKVYTDDTGSNLLGSITLLGDPSVQAGDEIDVVIHTALLDFSNNRRLYKKDSVFSIWIYQKDDNEDLLVVSIGRDYSKLLLTDSSKVGSKGKLPSRFIEKDMKLFYWWDDDYSLTDEALAVFQKYNLLQDDEGGLIQVPDFEIDDAQKDAHYYFCKNDLTKYKRVITNIGIGYYEAPDLKCKP